VLRRFLNVFRPSRLEAEIREEIDYHRNHSQGRFGNATSVAEAMRDASTIQWLETCLQDLRYAARQLLKAPVLLGVAVLSLALGIGANTAIFTLINAVMLQLLPVRDPGGLVLFNDDVSEGVTSGDLIGGAVSYPFYRHLLAHNTEFQELCAFRESEDRTVMHVAGEPETEIGYASVHLVSGNYFDVLGVRTAAGRLLNSSDDTPASAPVAVMSYRLWRDRFRLDASVVGRTVVLNGAAFRVAGVTDPSFFGERVRKAPDFWLPLSFQPSVTTRERSMLEANDVYWLNCMGRLRAGHSMLGAQAFVNHQLYSFYLAQAGSHPSAETRDKITRTHIDLKRGGSGISGLRYRYGKPLAVLMAVVALVLLIACANVATLLLARAEARHHEFTCRLALGASRFRVLRQVLTECVLLSLIGGLTGVVFAWWTVHALVYLLHFDPVLEVRPDPAVLAFTLFLSIATGLLFGLLPAWRFSRPHARLTHRSTGRWSLLRIGSAQLLITVQVALSLGLLVGATVLTRSLLALEKEDLGFSRDRVLLTRTDAQLAGYPEPEYEALYRELIAAKNIPGALSASLAGFSPMSGYSSSGNISIQGFPAPKEKLRTWRLSVSPGFFETLRIPLHTGRLIQETDTSSSLPVVVVNESFVKQFFAGRNPLGQHMGQGFPFKPPGAEIVGVVADSKFFDIRDEPKPMTFFPIFQKPSAGFELLLRTAAADPGNSASAVRALMKTVNSRLSVLEQGSLAAQVEDSLQSQRLITGLCATFGLLALTLACVGIYGTLAYSVNGRVAEIGTRMALGARRSQVIALVFRDVLFVLIVGLLLGLLLAAGGTRWLESFLFGVSPLDPTALSVSVAVLIATALFAGYLPARRASQIDPIQALRHE
jgi:predicted permease